MSFDQFLYFSLLTYIFPFVSIKQSSWGHDREPGGECHVLPTVPQPGDLRFKNLVVWPSLASSLWVCPVPATCLPHSKSMMMYDMWWCNPCIIDVHHPKLHTPCIKQGNYHLGLFSLNLNSSDTGLGSDLDLGVPSALGLGVSIIALSPWDLPHPDDHDSYIVG